MKITGYDGRPEDPFASVEYDLEIWKNIYTEGGRRGCRLLRNGVSVGLVYPKSEDEALWLRDRIKGTFTPSDEVTTQER